MRPKLRALAFVAASAALVLACHDATSTTTTGARAASSAPPPMPMPPGETVTASIYPLRVALRDQYGANIGSDVFRGHPVIVSMFYGSCPAACPLLVSQIKQVEASLPPAVRADMRVLLVSFDAARDTPDALRELANAHHVDTSRWRFAAGSDDEARLIANALGVSYRKGARGVFSHDSVISVLDGEGRIVARVDDPRADLGPLAETITRIDRL